MTTDRELLELAAKAAGVVALTFSSDMECPYNPLPESGNIYWNPLRCDGDALRLAVKLRISLIHEQEYMGGPVMETIEAITAPRIGDGARTCTTECINEHGCDEMARVRRAITRAAAQMQLKKEAV